MLCAATPAVTARAQPRVEIVVTPTSAQAEQLGARVLELVATAPVRPELRREPGDATQPWPDETLARVEIDLTASTHVRVRIRAADGAVLTRELPREQPELDEAAREEVAAVVASSVEALLAGEPLDARVPPHAPERGAPEHPRSGPPSPRPSPRRAREPAVAVPARESAQDGPPAHQSTPRTIAADTHYRVAVGYEVGLWDEGTWLHGPQLVLGYAVASGLGRLGVRAEGFVAWPERASGDPIDAEVTAAAVRILASLEPKRTSAFGFELGTGLSAQLTTLEAADVPHGTQPLEASSSMSWALRLYGGLCLHEGVARFALGTAVELDPVRREYGVRHPDGFVTSHSPAIIRPSLLASVGLGF